MQSNHCGPMWHNDSHHDHTWCNACDTTQYDAHDAYNTTYGAMPATPCTVQHLQHHTWCDARNTTCGATTMTITPLYSTTTTTATPHYVTYPLQPRCNMVRWDPPRPHNCDRDTTWCNNTHCSYITNATATQCPPWPLNNSTYDTKCGHTTTLTMTQHGTMTPTAATQQTQPQHDAHHGHAMTVPTTQDAAQWQCPQQYMWHDNSAHDTMCSTITATVTPNVALLALDL